MEIIGGWILFSLLVAVLASSRGRSGFLWFLLAIVISPVFAGLLVLILQNRSAAAITASGEVARPDTHVRCPDCRELVRADARKCKHCGAVLVPIDLAAQAPTKSSGRKSTDIPPVAALFVALFLVALLAARWYSNSSKDSLSPAEMDRLRASAHPVQQPAEVSTSPAGKARRTHAE